MTNRATLATWLEPEHVRWSFRHVRELVPTERIARGPVVRELPVRPVPELLDVVLEAHDGATRVEDLLVRQERDSLVVLHRGDVVLEWQGDGIGDTEPHLNFSVTKSVTGLLAGALSGAGLLDLSAQVVDYVPEVAPSGFGNATLRHLLDMEASYAFVEDYSPGPDVTAYRNAAGWCPAPADAPALQAFLASRAPDGEHGRRFRYLSPTTDMLGWVCARAAGTTWAQAVSTYLWIPLGAEADAEVTVDREGTPRAAGGMSTIPRDLARLGLIVAEGGAGIVPAAFVVDLLHGGVHEHWAAGDFAEMFPNGAYRSFWYRPGIDPDVVCGIGIHGQMLYVDVPRQVVVAVQSSWSMPDNEDWHLDNHAVCRALAQALEGGEGDAPH